MPRYHYRVSYHNQTRSLRRTKRLIFAVFALMFAGFLIISVDIARNILNKAQPTSTENYSAVQAANVTIFRTGYFQFQSSPSWREVANESRDGRYVYRSYDGHLVEQELIVEVNHSDEQALANVQTQRVIPVSVAEGSRLQAEGAVSDHCKGALKPGASRVPQLVTYSQVTFACNPDSATYLVTVGLIGGNENIPMIRPNGQKSTYRISYRNLTATPNVRDAIDIVSSFEAR